MNVRMVNNMDRKQANTALAKIIAYLNVGNKDKAQDWFDSLKVMMMKEGLK